MRRVVQKVTGADRGGRFGGAAVPVNTHTLNRCRGPI
jgi:hypothetical protein